MFVLPILEPSSLYFMPKQFGAVLECTDIVIWPNYKRTEFDFVWKSEKVPKKLTAAPTEAEAGNGEDTRSVISNVSTSAAAPTPVVPKPNKYPAGETAWVLLYNKFC